MQLGETVDHAEDVLVDEEVLAELLLRPHAHSEKHRVAFVVDARGELLRVLVARLRERGEPCGRRWPARSDGRGAEPA